MDIINTIVELFKFLSPAIVVFAFMEGRYLAFRKNRQKPIEEIKQTLESIKDGIETNNEATAYIIRYRLQINSERVLKRGYITFQEREELRNGFEYYFSLGFNHIKEDLLKTVMNLPIREKEQEKPKKECTNCKDKQQ